MPVGSGGGRGGGSFGARCGGGGGIACAVGPSSESGGCDGGANRDSGETALGGGTNGAAANGEPLPTANRSSLLRDAKSLDAGGTNAGGAANSGSSTGEGSNGYGVARGASYDGAGDAGCWNQPDWPLAAGMATPIRMGSRAQIRAARAGIEMLRHAGIGPYSTNTINAETPKATTHATRSNPDTTRSLCNHHSQNRAR